MSNLTPDQRFARYVKIAITFFILCFGYFVFADLYMPITPQARLYHSVTQITPQISGQIVKVNIAENAHVNQGDVLFEIDPEPFKIQLENAQLALSNVVQKNQQLDADILAVKANIESALATLSEREAAFKRAEQLIETNAISSQQYDSLFSQFKTANAAVVALKANLASLQVQRGKKGDENLAIKQAKNALASAKLRLSYTKVIASKSGVVSNMQITPGTFANQGAPLATLVSSNLDLVADFREKSLTNVTEKHTAKVVFDALPGKVFQAKITAYEAGVSDGQRNANGILSQVETSSRWVRDAQRQRIHFTLNAPSPRLATLTSGARATVQIVPDNKLAAWFANAQINLVSWLHFIY